MRTPYAREHANTKSEFQFDDRGNLLIRDAAIKFTNFSGTPTNVNPNGGVRTFSLVLSDAWAERLKADGWNIKSWTNDDGDIEYTTEIKVNMESKWPPLVVLYSEFRGERTATTLDEDTIGRLDTGRYENIRIAIHPHEHNVGQYRCKGYLRELRLIALPDGGFFGDMDEEWMAQNEHPREH